MRLRSPRFANDPRLQRAAENNPPPGWGESGEPVRKVQPALIDLGLPLPLSTRRAGSPDGVFGKETCNAVCAFQRREKLSPDGFVGRDTHGLLWFVFGWEVAGLNGKPNRKGRHALVLEGIVGDGTNEGSRVRDTDPADGKLCEIAFLTFIAGYELGFTLGGGVPDSKTGGFSQILHF